MKKAGHGRHPKSLKNLKRVPKGGPSPNPAGRPPDALGAVMRQLTASDFAEMGDLIIKGNIGELQRMAKDPTTPALKVWIASVVVKSIAKGDMSSLDTLLNRLVGKVKEKIEVTGADGGPLKSENKLAVEKLMSDPESFAHLAALEGKMNGKLNSGDK